VDIHRRQDGHHQIEIQGRQVHHQSEVLLRVRRNRCEIRPMDHQVQVVHQLQDRSQDRGQGRHCDSLSFRWGQSVQGAQHMVHALPVSHGRQSQSCHRNEVVVIDSHPLGMIQDLVCGHTDCCSGCNCCFADAMKERCSEVRAEQ
jgi:hypothetical protein